MPVPFGSMRMLLEPTEEERAEAIRLKIEGADKMNGPMLREAIRRAKDRQRLMLTAREQYRKWVAMCRALGVTIQGGRGAPKLAELKRIYAEELPAALVARGIVPGARLTIPSHAGLARSGRATVGKTWPMNSDDRIVITLAFDDQAAAHTCDAWLVWRRATNIEVPRG